MYLTKRKINRMLLEPTAKFKDRVMKSWHYRNCPKYVFNSLISELTRGELHSDEEDARICLTAFLKKWDHPTERVNEIVRYHRSVSPRMFTMHINKNKYQYSPPKEVLDRIREIDTWVKQNTPERSLHNPYPIAPTYPHMKSLDY